ncbi:MAG: hypothetical protein IPK39_05345 [Sulfuritalea sp.]|nr:hypothetical protein [Sulfuritalea sp.]
MVTSCAGDIGGEHMADFQAVCLAAIERDDGLRAAEIDPAYMASTLPLIIVSGGRGM